jgi:hypothetical protein
MFFTSPLPRQTPLATLQSKLISPKRAAAAASSQPSPSLPPGCAIVDLLIAHTGGQFGVGHGGVPCVIEHGGTTGSALPPPGAPLHVAATASDFSTPSHGSGTPPDRPSALRMHSDLLTQAAAAHAGVPGQLQLEFAVKPDAHEPTGVPYDPN